MITTDGTYPWLFVTGNISVVICDTDGTYPWLFVTGNISVAICDREHIRGYL